MVSRVLVPLTSRVRLVNVSLSSIVSIQVVRLVALSLLFAIAPPSPQLGHIGVDAEYPVDFTISVEA